MPEMRRIKTVHFCWRRLIRRSMHELLRNMPVKKERQKIRRVTPRKICEACLKLWGKPAQTLMIIEECAELIKALTKYNRRFNKTGYSQVCEEIADVEIMLDQARIMFDTNLIDNYKEEKITRLNNLVTFAKKEYEELKETKQIGT